MRNQEKLFTMIIDAISGICLRFGLNKEQTVSIADAVADHLMIHGLTASDRAEWELTKDRKRLRCTNCGTKISVSTEIEYGDRDGVTTNKVCRCPGCGRKMWWKDTTGGT